MRIGNLEDLGPKDSREALRDLGSETAPTETEQEKKKWKNWWYYYKWYVLCGILFLGIAGSLIGKALGIGVQKPDFQIAYIGSTILPQDTVTALEQAFASLASDFNGDGQALVRINQYVEDAEAAYYGYASEISLIGDISDCESYFFLLESPEQFQHEFQLLATVDGSCPSSTDYDIQDKVIPWAACPPLSGLELGAYSTVILGETVTGSSQELLGGLFLGRRCFFTDAVTDNADQCGRLWDSLYNAWQAADFSQP